MKNRKTQAHAYNGKNRDRFSRSFSKFGLKRKDCSKIFLKIENEKNKDTTTTH
jgi:hypothetical protein